jgi:hypothetical protein
MGSVYYLTMHEGEHFIPLEPSTTWVLFVLTLIIQLITFWCLEYCSNLFRDFMVMSSTDGRGGANEAPVVKPVVVQMEPQNARSMFSMNSYSNQSNVQSLRMTPPHTQTTYQHFHDTLDVSVFR